MIKLSEYHQRLLKIAAAALAILLLLLFLRQCSSDPTSGFDMHYGFTEASFKLTKDSRLPKWFVLHSGTTRTDITVKFNYFMSKTKIAAINNKNGQIIFSAEADKKHHPITLEESKKMPRDWPCPSYNIISVNGIEEVIEHAEPGNTVHIVENSQITSDVYNNAEMMKRCKTLTYMD